MPFQSPHTLGQMFLLTRLPQQTFYCLISEKRVPVLRGFLLMCVFLFSGIILQPWVKGLVTLRDFFFPPHVCRRVNICPPAPSVWQLQRFFGTRVKHKNCGEHWKKTLALVLQTSFMLQLYLKQANNAYTDRATQSVTFNPSTADVLCAAFGKNKDVGDIWVPGLNGRYVGIISTM